MRGFLDWLERVGPVKSRCLKTDGDVRCAYTRVEPWGKDTLERWETMNVILTSLISSNALIWRVTVRGTYESNHIYSISSRVEHLKRVENWVEWHSSTFSGLYLIDCSSVIDVNKF